MLYFLPKEFICFIEDTDANLNFHPFLAHLHRIFADFSNLECFLNGFQNIIFNSIVFFFTLSDRSRVSIFAFPVRWSKYKLYFFINSWKVTSDGFFFTDPSIYCRLWLRMYVHWRYLFETVFCFHIESIFSNFVLFFQFFFSFHFLLTPTKFGFLTFDTCITVHYVKNQTV